MNRMLLLLLLGVNTAAFGSGVQNIGHSWPLWDGHESITEYAHRADLPPTKSISLGNGINLELVLVPAGQFTMGTASPTVPNVAEFQRQVLIGQTCFAVGVAIISVFFVVILIRSIRLRQRPQYSLARFILIGAFTGLCLIGRNHWAHSARQLETSKDEFRAAKARYDIAIDIEVPAHRVTISRPFYMGKFLVTQEQFKQVCGYLNYTSFSGKRNPVDQVTWFEAQEFCKRVGEKMRLPTEAEWEYACRAGSQTNYYSGDTEADLDRVGWSDRNSQVMPHPVGEKEPNTFSLYDMHGNVWEWCQDWYRENYYSVSPAIDPKCLEASEDGAARVRRGGSWLDQPSRCRCASRDFEVPYERKDTLGFRVVMSAVE